MSRQVEVYLKNLGKGSLEWIDDHLSHGEWCDNRSPAQGASLIPPGEARSICSAEGGDIPFIGSIMTGNEGWVLYRTYASVGFGTSEPAWVRISWNLPYISFSSEGVGVWLEVFKYDPRTVVGSASFDDRDKSISQLQVRTLVGSNPEGDSFIGAWPVLFPPFILLESNLGVIAQYDFLNTSEPERTVIPPFAEGSKKNTISEPIINTDSSMWEGTWSGERITARISRQGDGSLVVSTEERRGDQVLISQRQAVGIQRVVATYALHLFQLAGNEKPNPLSIPNISVEKNIGTARAKFEMLRPNKITQVSLVGRNMNLIAGIRQNRIQIGGDYLEIEPDAVLEMYRLVADGEWVDTALRYRRPASGQMSAANWPVDELMYYYPDVH